LSEGVPRAMAIKGDNRCSDGNKDRINSLAARKRSFEGLLVGVELDLGNVSQVEILLVGNPFLIF